MFFLFTAAAARAQEPPYFVAYSHDLEEPDNLEIEMKGLTGAPQGGSPFLSGTMELEYGVKAWWTTEVYLSGQTTPDQSTLFTGYRWENRFRPFLHEHAINPVLYAEYEDTNDADRSLLEVVGHDNVGDLIVPNDVARQGIEREMELKLILSSNTHGWNISENFITEKALNVAETWEFGYALGISRPLSLAASPRHCTFCAENFAFGAEMYGGLGTLNNFGLPDTSHYAGPTVGFSIPHGPVILFSPNFGLNNNSAHVLYRFQVSYEFQQFFGRFRHGASAR